MTNTENKPRIRIQQLYDNKAMTVDKYSLVPILAYPRCLVIFSTIVISAIIKSSISFSNRSSSSLIIKMPMKTCERSVLCTFML